MIFCCRFNQIAKTCKHISLPSFIFRRESCSGQTDQCPSKCWDKCQKGTQTPSEPEAKEISKSSEPQPLAPRFRSENKNSEEPQQKTINCKFNCVKRNGYLAYCKEEAIMTDKKGQETKQHGRCNR